MERRDFLLAGVMAGTSLVAVEKKILRIPSIVGVERVDGRVPVTMSMVRWPIVDEWFFAHRVEVAVMGQRSVQGSVEYFTYVFNLGYMPLLETGDEVVVSAVRNPHRIPR